MSSMNPDITSVEVGIRKLREVTIYPLSVASQLEATEIIAKVVNSVATFEGLSDTEVVEEFLKLLKTSLSDILKLVLDEKEEIDFAELTNPQLENIVNVLFDKNYKDVVKNSKGLIEKLSPLLTSMGSLPKS